MDLIFHLSSLPHELQEQVWYHCVALRMRRLCDVHHALRGSDVTLHLTETIFPFEMDFEHATRLPKLEEPKKNWC